MDSLFDYEETLPGRAARFRQLLTEDLIRFAGEDAMRGRELARRLGQVTEITVEIDDPEPLLIQRAEETIDRLHAKRKKK